MITLNVNSLENAEIFWKELGLEEEIALNETYDPNPATLAISVETIDEIHDKIIELGLPLSLITKSADGRDLFSFIAPEVTPLSSLASGSKDLIQERCGQNF